MFSVFFSRYVYPHTKLAGVCAAVSALRCGLFLSRVTAGTPRGRPKAIAGEVLSILRSISRGQLAILLYFEVFTG